MAASASSKARGLGKGGIFLLFLVVEAVVFAILPLSARFPTKSLLYFQAGVTCVLLFTALALRRSKRGKQYWQVGYAFFVAGTAILLSGLYGDVLLRFFGLSASNPQGIAIAKVSESLWRVGAVLLLMAIGGADLRSLYIHKGRIVLGLAAGAVGFVVFAVIAFAPLAGQAGIANKLLSLSPWILIFVLANGFMEELIFRGLFLRRYQPFLGSGLSNLLAGLAFTLVHVQVTYASDLIQFLVILLPLALVWGFLMQRTDSIWGSALFHAGADCMIIFGVFANM